MQRFLIKISLVLLPLVASMGCGSGDYGRVTGTVKADGKPLAKATVMFYPQPAGRPSSCITDEAGAYTLMYTSDQSGAVLGEHLVRITTAVDGGDYGKATKETLPAKYNMASELKREVKPGSNVFDFELDYEGQIISSGY